MDRNEIIYWLQENDVQKLKNLWHLADTTRSTYVGNEVHLRGIIEISNRCVRRCTYCGINNDNKNIPRYTMTSEEIMATVYEIASLNYGTVVIQSGEDFSMKAEWIGQIVRQIKSDTNLAVTLSLGERKKEEFKLWKECGADRYLLKIETGNKELFKRIHPSSLQGHWKNRVDILQCLLALGYETGSGIMVGIPGQTYDDVANDLLLFKELGIHMMGIGPYIPHPQTTLAEEYKNFANRETQVPNSEIMTYKVNALARIICPDVNIPTTTALATINSKNGRELGLKRGANVIMPNFTPLKYRQSYEIYPRRICLSEFGSALHQGIKNRIYSVGRAIGKGPGSAPNLSNSGC